MARPDQTPSFRTGWKIMGSVRRATMWLIAALLSLDLTVPLQAALAADLPPYMAPIAGTAATTPGEVA